MITWYTRYLGIPWSPYATGPDSFDCWGLVYHCLSEYFDIHLSRYEGILTDDACRIHGEVSAQLDTGMWVKVDELEDGCVVLMSKRTIFHHIGLGVNGKVLHSRDGADVTCESISQLLQIGFRRIEYYRYERHVKSS